MRILWARDQQVVQKYGGYRRFVERLVGERWHFGVSWNISGEVHAEINRSGWIVSCPFCAGAQVIEHGEPFFCVDCVMQANDFQAMDVLYPAEIAEIEALLLNRPDPNNRNWLVGESVMDIRLENIQHGIEV